AQLNLWGRALARTVGSTRRQHPLDRLNRAAWGLALSRRFPTPALKPGADRIYVVRWAAVVLIQILG
ncbi:MAG TPA: hypothetical protein VLW52_04445, partial [Opitutaceae bacterium]|nr:hypothetical protein [Opitutaceae bacterium]